jgi:hypothetical protein
MLTSRSRTASGDSVNLYWIVAELQHESGLCEACRLNGRRWFAPSQLPHGAGFIARPADIAIECSREMAFIACYRTRKWYRLGIAPAIASGPQYVIFGSDGKTLPALRKFIPSAIKKWPLYANPTFRDRLCLARLRLRDQRGVLGGGGDRWVGQQAR